MAISWRVSKADAWLINQIAHRTVAAAKERGVDYDVRDIEMDLVAVHANAGGLRLADLAASSAADFAHDVFGIRRYLDRNTGKLMGHFCPRYHR